jgi:hypothetical protein
METTMLQTGSCKHGVPNTVKGHDCQYTDLRERLIPDAERHADDAVGIRPKAVERGSHNQNPAYEAWVKAWNKLFLDFIDAEVKKILARQEQTP